MSEKVVCIFFEFVYGNKIICTHQVHEIFALENFRYFWQIFKQFCADRNFWVSDRNFDLYMSYRRIWNFFRTDFLYFKSQKIRLQDKNQHGRQKWICKLKFGQKYYQKIERTFKTFNGTKVKLYLPQWEICP